MKERFMRILVATDGSRAGIAAVKFASKVAVGDRDSQLFVLTVDANGSSGKAGSRRSADAEKVLQGAARQVGRGSNRARFHVASARRVDEVPDVISREADRLRADMVVVGSEGRDTLDEWVVGGTALRLIYVARRPVTVVRAPRKRTA
jgi:nucleotide-binding universal stress UspA family protein